MKIIFHTDALVRNSKKTPASSGHTRETIAWRKHISEMMKENPAGSFDVCTTYLFKDTFNVIDPKDSTVIGIPSYMVKEVIDDARIGKQKCGWCGKITAKGETCGDHDVKYLTNLI
ncbi:hypothetical protein [Photobacterium kishitanii]|uniref:Uncharacterized protein n=1 Tax=Photobacterium kishitanii TaxID=318456 RepID=A0A2T3KLB2_9GAMM|nr:hypothetical protein [Photobacterium kishitanii]PSV00440.1 hypothetical protein C9J27_04730 [Photobacterium kishitanii]